MLNFREGTIHRAI
ncbi:hypothetical protein VCHC59A1_3692A, partial [Vibrio cholerae HC-59A1]